MISELLSKVDFNKPIDLAWPLIPKADTVKCYWAETPENQTIRVGSFVGSVKEGGSVNYTRVSLTPHGNGTHTECYGHVAIGENDTIDKTLARFLFSAKLVTLKPTVLENGDKVVTFDSFKSKVDRDFISESVILRVLTNEESASKGIDYSGTNPPYFDAAIAEWLVSRKVLHFLTDLPSVDRESDAGRLKFHKTFFGLEYGSPRVGVTISELLFFEKGISDGDYLLNLMVPKWQTDAAPSRPVIYKA